MIPASHPTHMTASYHSNSIHDPLIANLPLPENKRPSRSRSPIHSPPSLLRRSPSRTPRRRPLPPRDPMNPSSPDEKRILTVDDHPLLRAGVTQLINRQSDLVTCGEAHDVRSAEEAVSNLQPDLLLLDLRLGTDDTIAFIKAIRSSSPHLRILIFSQYQETIYAERAIRAGANGYILKDESAAELLAAIRAILSGKGYISRSIATFTARHEILPSITDPTLLKIASLSDREFHIFQLVGLGMTCKEIAQNLNLSIKTVETYRHQIKHKLNIANSSQLVHEATQWNQRLAPHNSKEPTEPQ
jgi:DNA-binding NarL/FixJ family response regulator